MSGLTKEKIMRRFFVISIIVLSIGCGAAMVDGTARPVTTWLPVVPSCVTRVSTDVGMIAQETAKETGWRGGGTFVGVFAAGVLEAVYGSWDLSGPQRCRGPLSRVDYHWTNQAHALKMLPPAGEIRTIQIRRDGSDAVLSVRDVHDKRFETRLNGVIQYISFQSDPNTVLLVFRSGYETSMEGIPGRYSFVLGDSPTGPMLTKKFAPNQPPQVKQFLENAAATSSPQKR